MKFRKTISALAALAMSVSCLAGLTITANAAVTYNYHEVLFGDKTMDGDTIKAVAPQGDFTSFTTVGATSATTLAEAFTMGDYTYADGSIIQHGRGGNAIVSFSDAVDSGLVHFEISNNIDAVALNKLCLRDGSGSNVVTLTCSNGANGNGPTDVTAYKIGNDDIVVSTFNSRSAWWHIAIDFDLDADTYSYTLKYPSAADTTSEKTGSGTLAAGTSIKDFYGNSAGANHWVKFDNVAIYSYEEVVPKYDGVINYKLNGAGDPVYSTTSSVKDGTVLTALRSVKDEEGNKYYTIAEELPTLTVTEAGDTAGTNVLNVSVRKAADVDYTVNAVLAPVGTAAPEVISKITSGKIAEEESVSYAVPEYIVKDNVAYKTTHPGSGNYFGKSLTVASTAYTENITYTPEEDVNAVFYAEIEDLDGFSKITADNASIRCSMAAGGRPTQNVRTKVTTLPAGKYKITTNIWGNAGTTFKFYAGAGSDDAVLEAATTGSRAPFTSEEFEVKSEADIYISASSLNNRCVDNILIEKTGDITHDVTIEANKPKIAETDAVTGMVGAPTFESIKANYDFENKKIFRVTIAAPTDADKATVPVVKIGDTEYKFTAADWTAVSDADGLSYYMEFVKRDTDKWETFGNVSVSFGTGDNAATKTLDLTE